MDSLPGLSHLHLKYCECCGGLWLRPEDAATAYCPPCERLLARLPARPPRSERKPPRRAPLPVTAALLGLLSLCPQELLFGWCV